MDFDKQAKAALAGGEALANEIQAAIRDIVISNAAGIERFHERSDELTKVDYQYLFFYAVSLVLFFASSAESWTEAEINSVIDRAAEDFVRVMRFRTADYGDPETKRPAIALRLQGTFEDVRGNFRRIEEVGREEERSDATFTLILMYLSQVHPASLTLLTEGSVAVFSALQRSFGLISISAYRYVSDSAR